MNEDLMVTAVAASFGVGYMIVCLAIVVVALVGMWKVFEKAGKPGWAAIIPIYNTYCLYDMAFGNGWLFLLMFVPCVNFIVLIICCIKLAKAFGQSTVFGVGLIFLPFIFMLILGFGDAQYIGADNQA